MFRQILVPLDGSPLAEKVLPVVRRLALATHGTVHLVRVVPPVSAAWLGWGEIPLEEAYENISAAGVREADAYLDGMRGRLAASGINTRVYRLSGDIAAALLDYERDMSIDLVVLSTHGHGGLARFALGSIAARLLRHGAAPILLVSAFAALPSLHSAVVPLDGSAEHEDALRAVASLSPGLVESVRLLRVVSTSEQEAQATGYLDQVAGRLAERGVEVAERRVVKGHAVAAVKEMAGTDSLVVMATYAHARFAHWLLSSLVDRVVHDQATTVLLVRAGAPAPEEEAPSSDAFSVG